MRMTTGTSHLGRQSRVKRITPPHLHLGVAQYRQENSFTRLLQHLLRISVVPTISRMQHNVLLQARLSRCYSGLLAKLSEGPREERKQRRYKFSLNLDRRQTQLLPPQSDPKRGLHESDGSPGSEGCYQANECNQQQRISM